MRVIVELEIDTTEHPEDVLEHVSKAMEVARYSVCRSSAVRKEPENRSCEHGNVYEDPNAPCGLARTHTGHLYIRNRTILLCPGVEENHDRAGDPR